MLQLLQKGVAEIIDGKNSKNTKKQTTVLFNVLVQYISHKKLNVSLENVSKVDLDSILSQFWVEVRKADGKFYKKTSFTCMRFAIQRQLKIIRGPYFDIIEDFELARSNEIFLAQCVVLKKKGLAKVDHHPPISEEDMK